MTTPRKDAGLSWSHRVTDYEGEYGYEIRDGRRFLVAVGGPFASAEEAEQHCFQRLADEAEKASEGVWS
jgi:hypothetical protein